MPSAAKPLQKRYHDLDALRAFAMLLGILLHAIFVNRLLNPNSVEQASSDIFMAVLSFIHGFRMPLFFLLSGFFTLMLWKKYGSRYLITNRIKKIVLPLIIFMPICTIISFSSFIVNKDIEQSLVISSNDPVLLEQFYQKNQLNSTGVAGLTSLQIAADTGSTQSLNWLLANGAEANVSNPHVWATLGGSTALDIARYRGKKELITALETHGALAVTTGENFKAIPLNNWSLKHLWFLWFLSIIISAFILMAIICRNFSFPNLPSWLMHPLARYFYLVPITMIFQTQMPKQWGPVAFNSIVIPLHLLSYYATFFAVGALYYQWQKEHHNLGQELKFWLTELLLAIFILFPLGMIFLFDDDIHRLSFDAITTLYCWLMVFGFMGLARRAFIKESSTIRYVSDATYFLYIAHMPVMYVFSNYFTNLDMSNNIKILLNLSFTTTLLFIIYHYGVRYHALGRWLNGPRVRKNAMQETLAAQKN